MSITKEAIDALHQRIKDLAVNSTPDQLAYLAKSLESIVDKSAISNIVQMTTVKEIIDALQKRLKDLAANSTPDQLAYLAKALESIVDKSAVSEIVQMTDGKLKELLSAARSHLNEINSNKENSISAITAAKTESVNEINTLRTNSLNTLKASSDSHISQLDTRKNANIAAINSVGSDHKDGLKGLVDNFRAVNDVPGGSSIMKEIKTRENQLKTLTTRFNSINDVPSGSSIIKEVKTRDEQLKTSLINEVKTRNEQLKNTFEIISDPEILLKTINENDLETWLSNTDNQKKFNKMLSNANAVLNITGYYPALDKLIRSPKAIQALMESSVALNIIAHTTAISILLSSEEVIKVMIASASAVNVMISLRPYALAIEAIASSGIALHAIVHSELACKAIEGKIWHQRSIVVSTLEASPSLFRKQAGVRIGDGATTQESGRGSATIYIPVSCHDDNDTRFYVASLIKNDRHASLDIYKHSGEQSITVGVVLRGVMVRGEGGSVGHVTFDIYTAI